MSSGSAALHAALTLAGVGSGDEVVSTAMTAEPTNTVIAQVGSRPIWADIDPRNGNLDPNALADVITPQTRAIMVVHYAGYPVDMRPILAIARDAGIPIIEDCAHALGAVYDDRPIGTIGDYAIFSFQAIKHLTTVDGGMLTMRDPAQLEAAKRFRWFGLDRATDRQTNDISTQGYKYNMTNVAATIGLAQLNFIGERLEKHIANGEAYDRAFSGMNHVQPARVVDAAKPSYWLYTLIAEDPDDIVQRLDGIAAASRLHRRNDAHSIFASSARSLPQLDRFYGHMLHIPCGWWVGPDDRARIIAAIGG
jgi:dTDP-4-amino-4,6-dideoxygalactose transaminase